MSLAEGPPDDRVGMMLVSADEVPIGEITGVLLDSVTRTKVATVRPHVGDGVQLIPLVETIPSAAASAARTATADNDSDGGVSDLAAVEPPDDATEFENSTDSPVRLGRVVVVFGHDQILEAPVVTVDLNWRTLSDALEDTRRHFHLAMAEQETDTLTSAPEATSGAAFDDGTTAAFTMPAGVGAEATGAVDRALPPPGPLTSEDDDPPWLDNPSWTGRG